MELESLEKKGEPETTSESKGLSKVDQRLYKPNL